MKQTISEKHGPAQELFSKQENLISRKSVLGFLRENSVIFGMFMVLIVFQCINNKFFAVKNLVNVLNQSSLLIIMSIGMMMAMSVRAVDLSTAQIADAAGLIAALLLIHGFPTWTAFTLPVIFGAVVGALNCLLVSYLSLIHI